MCHGHYVELQFSRRSILDLIRASLIIGYPPGNPILPPTGREFPRADDGSIFMVHRTVFLTGPHANALRRGRELSWHFRWSSYVDEYEENIPACRCEITQRLRLHVVRVESSDGQRQEIDVAVVEGTLLVVLGTLVEDNNAYVTIEASTFTVETPDLPPALLSTLTNYVPGSFSYVQSRLPIGQLVGQTRPHIDNCGMAVSRDGSVLALRVQLGNAHSTALRSEWIAFHDGTFPNRLVQGDGTTAPWGVLLTPKVVETMAAGTVEEQLDAHRDTFRLIGGVACTWAPEGPRGRVTGHFVGDLLVACKPRYQVSFTSRLAVTTPNTLTTEGRVDWDGDTWDLLACETLAGLAGGVAGQLIGAAFGGPLGMVVGFASGFVIGFVGAVVFATVYTPDLSTATCSFDDNTFRCTRSLGQPLVFGGITLTADLTAAVATECGLMLIGNLDLPIPALHHGLLEVELTAFDYTPLIVNCGNRGLGLSLATSDEQARNATVAQATATIRFIDDDGTHRRVPAVTVERLSADPAGIFPPESMTVTPYEDRTVVTITPTLRPDNSVVYFADPYGLRLAIRTVIGVRTVDFGPVPTLTPERLRRLRDDALRKLNDCLAKQRDPSKPKGRFTLDWLVDPPPDGKPHDRLWQIGVLQLNPGERIHATDLDGRLLAETLADEHGIARLAFLTPSGDRYRQVTLVGSADRDLTHEADLRVKQTVLVPQSTLRLDSPVQTVHTAEINQRQVVAVQTTTGVSLHDLTFPESPHTYARIDARHIPTPQVLDQALARHAATASLPGTLDGAASLRRATITANRTEPVPDSSSRTLHRRVDGRPEADAKPVPVVYYTAGSAILVPTADGSGLQCYAAGPSGTG